MQSFLRDNPNTTGSRFIQLLQTQLFGNPEWEPHRQTFCGRTLPLCIGGYHNSNAKLSSHASNTSAPRFSTSLDRIFNYYNNQEPQYYCPRPTPPVSTMSAASNNMGTNKVCQTLFLAAACIDPEYGFGRGTRTSSRIL
jgi:hypothetical protein